MWRQAALVLALGLGAAGCDDFSSVKKAGTIEAYETYVAANPTSSNLLQASLELESLYIGQARELRTLEAFDAYLNRYPKGIFRKDAMLEREDMLMGWAESEWTAEAWERFLKEYPRAHKSKKAKARKAISVLKVADDFTIGAPIIEQINLAEDPEGELDGWGITVPVTNNSDRVVEYMQLQMLYTDADGDTLQIDKWPVVARDFGLPIEEEKKVPIKPGETRDWYWTTGDTPEGWARTVKMRPSAITFKEAKP
jgi:hypothetical protein